jgi:hypothetical protein
MSICVFNIVRNEIFFGIYSFRSSFADFFSLREEPLALKKSAKSNLNLTAPKKKIGHNMGLKDFHA